MAEEPVPPPVYKAKEPMFAADDRQDVGTVRVSVAIPGLRVNRKLKMKGILPKYTKEEANAAINIQYETMAFTLTVEGKGDLEGKCWALRIRKLHHPVKKDDCHHEVKNGRILVFLRKQTVQSWYPELAEGLDAFDDDEEYKKRNAEDDKVEVDERNAEAQEGEPGKSRAKGDDDEGGEENGGEDDDDDDDDDDESDEDDESEDDEDENEAGKGNQDNLTAKADSGPSEPMAE